MNHQDEKVINQTANGKLFTCSQCGNVHLDYKNLSFSFSVDEYKIFRTYFLNLDEEYWAKVNREVKSDRKIKVPISHRNLMLSFSTEEIRELKLLFGSRKKPLISYKIINHSGININLSAN